MISSILLAIVNPFLDNISSTNKIVLSSSAVVTLSKASRVISIFSLSPLNDTVSTVVVLLVSIFFAFSIFSENHARSSASFSISSILAPFLCANSLRTYSASLASQSLPPN